MPDLIDLEEARAERMVRARGVARYGKAEIVGRRVRLEIVADLTPAAVRTLIRSLGQLADQAEREASP